MTNLDVRQKAKDSGVFLYQIAEHIGINDGNFSRKLRKEFSPDEKQRVLRIIEEIAAKRGANE